MIPRNIIFVIMYHRHKLLDPVKNDFTRLGMK
jgi:hypothetical protein